jgi:hypothetical protein
MSGPVSGGAGGAAGGVTGGVTGGGAAGETPLQYTLPQRGSTCGSDALAMILFYTQLRPVIEYIFAEKKRLPLSVARMGFDDIIRTLIGDRPNNNETLSTLWDMYAAIIIMNVDGAFTPPGEVAKSTNLGLIEVPPRAEEYERGARALRIPHGEAARFGICNKSGGLGLNMKEIRTFLQKLFILDATHKLKGRLRKFTFVESRIGTSTYVPFPTAYPFAVYLYLVNKYNIEDLLKLPKGGILEETKVYSGHAISIFYNTNTEPKSWVLSNNDERTLMTIDNESIKLLLAVLKGIFIYDSDKCALALSFSANAKGTILLMKYFDKAYFYHNGKLNNLTMPYDEFERLLCGTPEAPLGNVFTVRYAIFFCNDEPVDANAFTISPEKAVAAAAVESETDARYIMNYAAEGGGKRRTKKRNHKQKRRQLRRTKNTKNSKNTKS